jgi:hypothetical protein
LVPSRDVVIGGRFAFAAVIIHRVDFRLPRSQHIRPPAASRSLEAAARDGCNHRLDERGEIPVRETRIAVLAALVAMATSAVPGRAAAEDPAKQPAEMIDPATRAITGTVVSTMNVSNYTYIELDTGNGIVWAAAPVTEVEKGEMVFVHDPNPMPNFYSTSLDRRFEMIYFGTSIQAHGSGDAGIAAPGQQGLPSPPSAAKVAETEVTGIERAEGGKTVGEIFANKDELVGQQVTVRGKVVKSNSGIMGRNWIHVRDGTAGPEGNDDLTVTSTANTADVGNTVLVRGTVVADKDFGYGYHYDLMIENATITTE